MKNRDLERTVTRTKKELEDFNSTAESIIDDLVSEIETLEDDKEKAEKYIEELEKEIEALKI